MPLCSSSSHSRAIPRFCRLGSPRRSETESINWRVLQKKEGRIDFPIIDHENVFFLILRYQSPSQSY